MGVKVIDTDEWRAIQRERAMSKQRLKRLERRLEEAEVALTAARMQRIRNDWPRCRFCGEFICDCGFEDYS